MSFKFKLIFILILAGGLLTVAGFGEAMLFIKGNNLDLTSAKLTDFGEKTLCEGEIDFALSPFATYEVTETKYGFVKNKSVTKFYLVGKFKNGESISNVEEFVESDDFISKLEYMAVLSVHEGSEPKNLASLAGNWENFLIAASKYLGFDGEPPEESYGTVPAPDFSVNISGKLWDQPSEDEYEEILNDYLDGSGIYRSEIGTMRIICGDVNKSAAFGLFFGGIALMLLGVVVIVKGIVSSVKRKNSAADNYY